MSDAAWQASPPVQAGTAYAANALNQYTAVGGAALAYDIDGNLTADGAGNTFRYDAQGRLVGATVGSQVLTYGYDPEGRRAVRTAGGVTTRLLFTAAGQEIAEYGGAGGNVLVRRHVFGAGADEPLVEVSGPPGARARLWYHADAQGSVVARTNAAGAVPAGERYSYTPWGEPGAGSGSAAAFRWAGRRLDPLTGQVDLRARVYAPALGRFLQPDPIGTAGGVNLYGYAANDPLNRFDPLGLSPQESGRNTNALLQPIQYAAPGGPIPLPLPPVAIPGTPANESFTRSTIDALRSIQRLFGSILANENDEQANRPPAGSRPIDQTPWSGDHRAIKDGVGARPNDDVRISPDGRVWVQNPDGTWRGGGPAADYTESGRPSGRSGVDRGRRR